MTKATGILLFSLIMTELTTSAKVRTTPPVTSKGDVEYIAKQDQKMLDLGKVDQFMGIFVRNAEPQKDLRQVDVYVFPEAKETKISPAVCEQLLGKIFGPLKESSLKYHGTELYQGRTGKTCLARLDDPDRSGKFPQRYVLLGVINLKIVGLVFKLAGPANAETQENMKSFWQSLR